MHERSLYGRKRQLNIKYFQHGVLDILTCSAFLFLNIIIKLIVVIRDIEDRIQEMYFTVATRKIHEENDKLNLKNSKIVKIVTPDTTKSKSATDEIRSSKIVDLQLLVLTELVKMTPVETWNRLKKQDAFGNVKTPFDFFPNTCVALCEINRIGNEVKLVRKVNNLYQALKSTSSYLIEN